MDTLITVSYTHLDVYKRQVWISMMDSSSPGWREKNMIDIKSLTLPELQEEMEKIGEKKFHAGQIYEWMHVKLVDSFDEMTNLSKGLREKLKAVSYTHLWKSNHQRICDRCHRCAGLSGGKDQAGHRSGGWRCAGGVGADRDVYKRQPRDVLR